MSVKVAVILPSRGLIFSETAQEILDNLKGIPHKFFFSHGRPIPDCFEIPAQKALKDKSITHLWFIEDDMKLRQNTLKKLLEADANAITCDYPITKEGKGSVFADRSGRVIFCGTGCLLVKREVFKNLKLPYFTDRVRWTFLNYGESVKLIATPNKDGGGYGLHDITFCIKLWNAGVIIKVLPVKLGQRRLVEWGKSGSNNGQHQIETWTKLIKDMRLKDIQSQPIAQGAKSKLVVVDTPTGAVSTTQRHADNLVEQGLATYPPKRHTIIDDGGLI